jgi:hypothetical protein
MANYFIRYDMHMRLMKLGRLRYGVYYAAKLLARGSNFSEE